MLAGTLLLAGLLPAQSGLVLQGATLGPNAAPAGDVDDDGIGDIIVALPTRWEVRSGATGLALPALTRAHGGINTFYYSLLGDLDADGYDDLVYLDRQGGRAQLVSGRNGGQLFAVAHPTLVGVSQAADHDADGTDDVMVVFQDNVASLRTFVVLSGRFGAPLATFQFGFSATGSRAVAWVGDVDGDGFVDLNWTTLSFAQPFFAVTAGPDHVRTIHAGSGPTERGFDTDGDGRDELWITGDLVDCTTGQVVWSGVPTMFQPPLDLDGDGAADLDDNGTIRAGSTHAAFPGAAAGGPLTSLGDIDGDGRDEAVYQGTVFELVGGVATSRVRDRGASGTTGNQARPRIRHRLRPRVGRSMLVDLNGGGGANLVFLAIGWSTDVDLGPLGAPGNHAYVHSFTATAQVADARGHARRVLGVPTAGAVLGLGLSLQWAVFDPSANALGLATSNALDLVVGP